MEVKLVIIQDLPLQSGIGKTSGKEWQMKAYVGETLEQYKRKVHFEIFGSDLIDKYQCEIGKEYTVHFDIESREFNGRWYTSIRAWKIEESVESNQNAVNANPVAGTDDNVWKQEDLVEHEETTDLPF